MQIPAAHAYKSEAEFRLAEFRLAEFRRCNEHSKKGGIPPAEFRRQHFLPDRSVWTWMLNAHSHHRL